jgi:hypothetical protein
MSVLTTRRSSRQRKTFRLQKGENLVTCCPLAAAPLAITGCQGAIQLSREDDHRFGISDETRDSRSDRGWQAFLKARDDASIDALEADQSVTCSLAPGCNASPETWIRSRYLENGAGL